MVGRNSRTASAICDRTGVRYPMSEMVVEPGTGYLVHKSVSDGEWNIVDHPLNNIQRYVRFGDPFPIQNARPDISHVLDLFLIDEDGEYVLDGRDMPIDAPIF